jgi:type VI secretion system protein VasJ
MVLIDALTQENGAILEPLPGASPGGSDRSLEPEFEALKAEIDKLTSIAGGAPNWPHVADGAARLLSSETKDWRLAAWLTVARAHVSGFRGVASGMLVFRALSTSLWDKSFPDARRARARANLYAWLTEQLTTILEPQAVRAGDQEALGLAESLLNEVDGALSERLGDAHPGPGRLRTVLRNLLKAAAPPPAPPPLEAPTSTSTSTSISTPTSAAPLLAPSSWSGPVPSMPRPSSSDEVSNALSLARRVLLDAAAFLRSAALDNPLSYRVHRLGLWMMSSVPQAVDGRRTGVSAPRARAKEALEDAFEHGRWASAVDEAEFAMLDNPFWLDAQRISATALERLGHRLAREEIGRQVVAFVQRLPEIATLQFDNDMPFASPETVVWLEGEVRKYGGGGAVATDERLEGALKAAETAAAEGRLGEGLNAVVELAFRAGSGRERFRAILRASVLAMQSGAANLARPMLEGLVEDAQRHGLEVWDPALCVELYRTLIQAIRAETGANVDHSQREAVLFEKLCRLDPAAALVLARR